MPASIEYLTSFLVAANSATAPGVLEESCIVVVVVINFCSVGDGRCAHSVWSSAWRQVDWSVVYLLDPSAGVGFSRCSDARENSCCRGSYHD